MGIALMTSREAWAGPPSSQRTPDNKLTPGRARREMSEVFPAPSQSGAQTGGGWRRRWRGWGWCPEPRPGRVTSVRSGPWDRWGWGRPPAWYEADDDGWDLGWREHGVTLAQTCITRYTGCPKKTHVLGFMFITPIWKGLGTKVGCVLKNSGNFLFDRH